MLEVPILQKLIHELERWPGVGPKTAERLAYHLTQVSKEQLLTLATTLQKLPDELKHCESCGNYTQDQLCYFCRHPGRQSTTICVVKDPFAIERIEKTQAYKGRYHVLHGVIDILNDVTPDHLNIASLLQRIDQGLRGMGPKIEEVIIALDSDLEGEATTLYLQEVLQVYPLRITRLARGVPMGSHMGYLDERTLSAALQNRVEISSKTGSHK